jgi:hypothetical protein
MRYPAAEIDRMGGVPALVERANAHPQAPRVLEPAAVYMWKKRDTVPWMWRPVMSDLLSAQQAAE